MNHPKHEEWVPYLFGEANSFDRRQLQEHLQSCGECRDEIEAWQRSLGRLNAWKLPRAEKRREAFTPVLRWAMAAALVLGLGFGLGRSSAPAGVPAGALLQVQHQMSNSLAALEARLTNATEISSRELLQGVTQALDQARTQDRQAVLALFRELEERHTATYVALRKDLETLASLTDDEIRQARLKLIELAGYEVPKAAQ
ncbi:MAG: hypothetical protein HZA90_07415 [Verrucomicrobia bacterium]|nr:hypothetical protein [Verrucomicrobiota bacterium]